MERKGKDLVGKLEVFVERGGLRRSLMSHLERRELSRFEGEIREIKEKKSVLEKLRVFLKKLL